MEKQAVCVTEEDDPTPQTFTIRHDSVNQRHARITVFANSAHCGTLTMTIDEWIAFCAVVKKGAEAMETIELKFDAAFELHPPGHEPRVTWKQLLPPFEPRIILAEPRPIEPTLERMRPGLEEDARRASKD